MNKETTAAVKAAPIYTYRLLAGQHTERVEEPDHPGRLIKQGEIFESIIPWYAERWPEKFQRLDAVAMAAIEGYKTLYEQQVKQHGDPVAQKAAEQAGSSARAEYIKNLETMTVNELRKHAQEEEIDLGAAKSKDEMIRVLLNVTASRQLV